MRKIQIKVDTNSIQSISNRHIGYNGEHLATELEIEIPQNLVEEADFFILVFNDGTDVVSTGRIGSGYTEEYAWLDGCVIHCLIWQQLTLNRNLSVTVEGYAYDSEEVNRIFKLHRIEGLVFLPANEIIEKEACECTPQCPNKSSLMFRILGDLESLSSKIRGLLNNGTDHTADLRLMQQDIALLKAISDRFSYDSDTKDIEYDGMQIATVENIDAILQMIKALDLDSIFRYNCVNDAITMRVNTPYAGMESGVAYVDLQEGNDFAILTENGVLEVEV